MSNAKNPSNNPKKKNSRKQPRYDIDELIEVERKPRKVIINTNKQLKQANNKLKRQVKRLMLLSKEPFTQTKWNHTRSPTLFKAINDYHDNSLAEYVYGLFHPDAVFTDNLNIKAPSVLPIPTSNFAFKETFTLTPNSKGNFVLCWNPNYLGSSAEISKFVLPNQQNQVKAMFSNIYYDTHEDLDGNSAATHFNAQVFKHITQEFAKYRLTSACIKVKYTGKVLDQAGCLSACASFSEFPRTALCVYNDQPLLSTYEVPNLYPTLQRLGDFDTIRQGQWAKTVSLVNSPDGLTCVYIPTDSLSQVFVDNGDTISAKDISLWYPAAPQNATGSTWYSRNANITYDICGYGIFNPQAVPCITVEAYYNYEIIVHEDQLPFFRPTVTKMDYNKAAQLSKATQQIASTVGTITQTKSHDDPSVMSRIASALREGFKLAEPYLPLIKMGISLM